MLIRYVNNARVLYFMVQKSIQLSQISLPNKDFAFRKGQHTFTINSVILNSSLLLSIFDFIPGFIYT